MLKKTMILCLCAQMALQAQNAEITGTLTGSDGAPVPFALVSLQKTQIHTLSSENGVYSLKGFKEGTYLISVKCTGYLEKIDTLRVSGAFNWSPVLALSSKQLDEVVVSAGRVDDRNGMAYSNLSKEAIAKQNLGQDAPYLLNTLPNVVVNSDAGNGIGYTGLRVRGSDPTRINVTINGVPVNDAESQGTFWVNFPDLISSTDNVQLQRGVGTSANGAGAFGASLNFQTNSLKDKPYVQEITTAGSFGTLRNTLMAGTGLINNKFSIDGRLSKINSDGYIDRASSDLASVYLSAGYYSKKSVLKFITFGGQERTYQAWNLVPEDSVKFGNRRYNSCGEYTDANGKVRYYSNQTDNYRQNNYQLHLIHHFNSRLNLNVTGHYTKGKGYYENYESGQELANFGVSDVKDENGNLISTTDLINRLWLDNDFAGGVFNLFYKPNSSLAFTLGGGYNTYFGRHFGELVKTAGETNILLGQRYGMNTANKNDGNLYLKTNIQISRRSSCFIDLQTRGVSYSFLGFNDSLVQQMKNVNYVFFNPKIGYSYDLSASSAVYASLSRANKEPNRDDFVNSNPRSRPKSEQLTDLEAGFRIRNKIWLLNINLYAMQYKNQLVLNGQINNVGAYNRVNVATSFRRGIELEAQRDLGRYLTFGANISFSQNQILGFSDYVDSTDASGIYVQHRRDYKQTDIAFSPSSVAAVIFSIKPLRDLEITFTEKFVGRQYLDNTSNSKKTIDPYAVLDARINYSLKTKIIPQITFMLSAYNVFSKAYVTNGYTFSQYYAGELSHYNYYASAAPLNFLGGLSLKF